MFPTIHHLLENEIYFLENQLRSGKPFQCILRICKSLGNTISINHTYFMLNFKICANTPAWEAWQYWWAMLVSKHLLWSVWGHLVDSIQEYNDQAITEQVAGKHQDESLIFNLLINLVQINVLLWSVRDGSRELEILLIIFCINKQTIMKSALICEDILHNVLTLFILIFPITLIVVTYQF